MTTVARGFSINFVKISPNIAHSLSCHQINFEVNRIDGDEYIVFLRFFGGHVFTKILYRNYLLHYIHCIIP